MDDFQPLNLKFDTLHELANEGKVAGRLGNGKERYTGLIQLDDIWTSFIRKPSF